MDGYCPICGAERDTAWGELALHTGRTIYMCGTSSDPEGVRQSAHCRVGVWEDSCTLNLKSHMVAFNDDGLCESFEEGVCEYYREGAIDKE